ncbi:MAG: glycosyltransferase family 2 protein [Bacteroidales bacterium]|nr:glycosyltransferase family 2 protein [Bacteroidales bacterium]
MKTPTFSFIIPHKNTPDLLQKCLDSIPHRKDVEIIVVDDNSDPTKVDFEHFPGLNDACVKVIFDKDGGGCSHATNIALNNATGKWIVRGDADDFFEPDIVKAMDEYADSNYDIIFFKASSINLLNNSPAERGDTNNNFVDEAIKTGDFTHLFCNSCPWAKFYKRAFIETHNLRFHEVKWSTEVLFQAQYALLAKSYCASPLVIYCVTSMPGTMISNNSLECRIVRFEEDSAAIKLYRKRFKDLEFVSYWHFRTWFNIYKTNKWAAIKKLPQALNSAGFLFVKQVIRAL